MSLKGIMSIGGQSGLYKVVSQTKSGFVVESMTDHKKTVVQSTQKISMLNDISIYTTKEEIPLNEVLLKIKEASGDNLPVNAKSEPKELKNYFKTVLPDYDEERVYASHIKKIVSWYPLVKDILAKDEESTEKTGEDETADEKTAAEPASKANDDKE